MMRHIALLVFLHLGTLGFAQHPDIDALQALHTHRNKALDPAFTFTTASASVVSMAVPVAVFGTGFVKKDRTLMRKGVYIAGSMAVNVGATYALKYSINRSRPYEKYPNFIVPYQLEGSPAMPSGHTSNAFATATSLTLAFPKWYIAAPGFAWATAVSYSRIHLGVHYPSDVIIGAAVGAGSAWLCHWLNQRIFQKNEGTDP